MTSGAINSCLRTFFAYVSYLWSESDEESFNFMKYYVITHSSLLESCEACMKGYEEINKKTRMYFYQFVSHNS